MKCPICRVDLKQQKRKTNGNICIWCPKCSKNGEGRTLQEAENNFRLKNDTEIVVLPKNSTELINYASQHINDIMEISAPFVARDKPALERMIKKNIKYVMNRKEENFMKCWTTEEGRESIISAMEEAFSLGAIMPDMGCIVPYGSTVEFIPSVEAYEFALTNGNESPFLWIQIETIHENDDCKIKRINGEFTIELSASVPRGDVISVAVYGKSRKSERVIGDVYDKQRLLDKAENHSVSYKYYLQDLNAFEQARSEGKVEKEGSREYIMKIMYKKDKSTWKKKLYFDEITNPYVNSDQPEMLRKSAGKTFLRKYVRVRNSEAAINEIKEEKENNDIDSIINSVFQKSMDAVNIVPDKEEKMEYVDPAKVYDEAVNDPYQDEENNNPKSFI